METRLIIMLVEPKLSLSLGLFNLVFLWLLIQLFLVAVCFVSIFFLARLFVIVRGKQGVDCIARQKMVLLTNTLHSVFIVRGSSLWRTISGQTNQEVLWKYTMARKKGNIFHSGATNLIKAESCFKIYVLMTTLPISYPYFSHSPRNQVLILNTCFTNDLLC